MLELKNAHPNLELLYKAGKVPGRIARRIAKHPKDKQVELLIAYVKFMKEPLSLKEK
jgi:hypothetical protein